MGWEIDKSFSFEMGHRVWSQKLKHQHLSVSTDCACKHLHGHSYELKVFVGSDTLDESDMVTDFKNLNFVKSFLDGNLDHKFMVDVRDPNFTLIAGTLSPAIERNFINLSDVCPSDNADEQLHRNSFVLVGFVPTSENICRYLAEYIQSYIGDIAHVTAIELWETKKSHCRYVP